MASEREIALEMVQLLDQTDRRQDVIDLMKRVIELNPVLNADERNRLSCAYKGVITVCRNGLRIISGHRDLDEGSAARAAKLAEFASSIVSELDAYCLELIGLIDDKLIAGADGAEARLFYEKLRADYYRYVSENKEGAEKAAFAEKAKEAYERALDIANREVPPHKPTYLGLILNYSVYLYEIVGQREEAIALAEKTFNECSQTIDTNSEGSIQEASGILRLLRENVEVWSTPRGE